ncbi:MAG: GGDEF domain-containing protein [Terracidiphilus sp.]|jgi:diguanylate cyclase (GGDEF)-like protein
MISLKKYLDTDQAALEAQGEPGDETGQDEERAPSEEALLTATIAAYRSALIEMGQSSLDATPAHGLELKQGLCRLDQALLSGATCEVVAATQDGVRQQLQGWGRRTAAHLRQQVGEVKDLLLAMARTAESVGQRDQRCAHQINEVTTRLKRIANLEDLTEIRASIEKSASELKSSIDRMTAEGKAVLDRLRLEVAGYQAKLEAAEEIASCDSLTGLRSRLCVEGHIQHRVKSGLPFCVAIVDIDGFKQVNDDHGHLAGDELLRQFAGKLRSACRSTDLIGRWGGDEFVIVLYCGIADARAQSDRFREWVCGSYTVQGSSGPGKLRVDASIGLAEHLPKETMKELLARADAAMYRNKAASRGDETRCRR